MTKFWETFFTLVADICAVNLSFLFAHWMAFKSGFGGNREPFWLSESWDVALVLSCYWIFLLFFFGLYRSWKYQSRLDEIVSVSKAVLFGVLLAFAVTFESDNPDPLPRTRVVLFSYMAFMVGAVSVGRLAIASFQRCLLNKGIGTRRSVIVGRGKRGRNLLADLRSFPALGYHVMGFVAGHNEKGSGDLIGGVPVLGKMERLPEIISDYKIEEVLIVGSESRDEALEIVSSCDGSPVKMSIVPDLYDIVSGHARTNQLYGFPLMELLPELMPAWEKKAKRILDILVSVVFLVGFAPLWVIIAVLIKLDSKGPVFFSQKRVGKGGKIFATYKFRSMVEGAESMTGPVWAKKDDPRVTRIGRVLRKMRLDEIPQFLNVLDGDMSFVGPRPERPFFVEKLKKEVSLYSKRLNVQPGITGWAQIKHTYDRNLDDVVEKLKYDLYYIENMSLRMDLKILLRTIWVMLRRKGAH